MNTTITKVNTTILPITNKGHNIQIRKENMKKQKQVEVQDKTMLECLFDDADTSEMGIAENHLFGGNIVLKKSTHKTTLSISATTDEISYFAFVLDELCNKVIRVVTEI